MLNARRLPPSNFSCGCKFYTTKVDLSAIRDQVVRHRRTTSNQANSKNIQSQPSDASVLIPQHNYKLDVHALNSRHPGQFECREFRESVLGVMPHHWDRREDTSIQLAHFRRHKRKTIKKTPGKAVVNNVHKPSEHNPPGKDVSNRLAKAIGKVADMAGSNKAKMV